LGDRVAVMMEGTLQQVDSPQMLYLYPANQFVAGFVGTPPMNFLTMDIVTEEGQIYLKHNGLKVPVSADMAVGLKDYPKDKVLMA